MLFKLAKENLGGADFAKVYVSIPGMDSLISTAPASGGMLGGLGKMFGGAGGLASLAGVIQEPRTGWRNGRQVCPYHPPICPEQGRRWSQSAFGKSFKIKTGMPTIQ